MRGLPLYFLSILALSACGGGANPDKEAAERIPANQRVGAQKVEILSGTPAFADGTISGSGTVRFAEPLAETDSANNFALSLELSEGSSVTLVANANRDLGAGIEIEIARPASSVNPRVTARAGGDTLDLSPLFTSVNVSAPMQLAFDLHNNEPQNLHLVAFNDAANGAELGSDVVRGKGTGANWGLRLAGGKITGLVKSAPRDIH